MTHSFHLSCRVTDLEAALRFYAEVLGCECGEGGDGWTNIDLFGHQLTLHRSETVATPDATQILDHFGVSLPEDAWSVLVERIETRGVQPKLLRRPREPGNPDPRGKLLIADPDGTTLEFKCPG